MTRFIALPLVLGVGLLAVSATGADKLKVVTTIPDLADMTRQIGGDQVDVTSLATGVEDIHAVPMKPSFAVTLNRADALVLLGLEAEHAFLRSEEHTSELQSQSNLVCRLLLEKKKKKK